jgi:N-acyl homoserine lactone hydrolase
MTGLPIHVTALPLGEFTFGSDDPWPGEAGLVIGYAIRHPGGVFLFDTGFVLIEPGDPELDEFYAKYKVRPRPLLEAMDRAGIHRDEVTGIANCHLHLDHCGQNDLFPGVPIYVQPSELEAARGEDYTVARVYDFDGARLEPKAGDHEIAPGIRVFATPGHSPGHQSLVIETPKGSLLLAGQAVYSAGEWAGTPGARIGSDDIRAQHDSYRRSVARLKALRPKRVLFGHDRHGWPD